ncbi:MAG: hypothetical protein WA172_12080 [Terriglobales bacterium]
MKMKFALLCAILLYSAAAYSQLGVNCGEHHDIFRNHAGIVWFTSGQMEKQAIKRIQPVMPPSAPDFHYDGFVTFKVLVDTKGEIGCIWDGAGNSLFLSAVNQALQYWKFKPMLMEGKPVEFVGVVKFRVHTN